jgi:transcriptional regulator with XRE-family HTH domain
VKQQNREYHKEAAMNAHARTIAPDRNPREATNIDAHVGARVRLRRQWLKLSQEKLANALGITFQQVQKYERGDNRIGASRLYDMARALDVPVGYFFDGLDTPEEADRPALLINQNTGILLRQHAGMNAEGQRALQRIATTLSSLFPQDGGEG